MWCDTSDYFFYKYYGVIYVWQARINEVYVIGKTVVGNHRDYFLETYKVIVIKDVGLNYVCIQGNHSFTS